MLMSPDDTQQPLKAPYPYFGGKSRVAHAVWERFGDVPNYVEPFFGSGAVLLNRPHAPRIETVNDADGFVANFWRAVQHDPDAVAYYADWPVNEIDLHARHLWLLSQRQRVTAGLYADPEWFDVQVAGWWCWGLCCWIGGGWCEGNGPWVLDDDGQLVNRNAVDRPAAEQGIKRLLPHLGDAGRGIKRVLPHLGDAGQGIKRNLPHLGNAGRGALVEYIRLLAHRLANVRVCCGDFERVLGKSVTFIHGMTAVFLDPPYDAANDRHTTYGDGTPTDCFRRCVAYCEANCNQPDLRIALCGYEGDWSPPDDWETYAWKAPGGYGNQAGDGQGRANAQRERIWFSPNCLRPQPETHLFMDEETL